VLPHGEQYIHTICTSAGTLSEEEMPLSLLSHIPYRDTIILDSKSQRRLLSAFQNADGNWVQFMEVKYTR